MRLQLRMGYVLTDGGCLCGSRHVERVMVCQGSGGVEVRLCKACVMEIARFAGLRAASIVEPTPYETLTTRREET